MARVLMKGCEAIAEAAVRAGCRFFAGYPITPQNEIPEYFARRLPEVGGNFVQGESEVASVNMVYGAAAAGTRSMTSSSSPGIALKSEGISYCAAARVPIVYSNISRGGPGVGAIQPAQQDYFQATKASGNGGFRMMVLAPSTVQEAVDLTYAAFDYADRDMNPVLILADGVIGTMMEPVELPEMKSDEEHQFTKPLAVLVNGNSASASEIYSGAIQDYGIGKIVGTQTYGKGVVQQIFDLDDGTAVKLTIAEYFTPKGRSINGKGITPDVKIKYQSDEENPDADNQLEKAVETVKAQMK